MARRTMTDAELDAEVAAAMARAAVEVNPQPIAAEAWFDADRGLVTMLLTNGCLFAFPPSASRWIANATPRQLAEVTVEQDGEGLHWEELDADISVPGIISQSLRLSEWAPRLLGARTSEAKARAARANGSKGGRPRKRPVAE